LFLLSYFESIGSGGGSLPAPVGLIAVLRLYLTDFLTRAFSGENAQNRAFCGGQKLEAAAVYPAPINQGPRPVKIKVSLTLSLSSPAPNPVTRTIWLCLNIALSKIAKLTCN
jgi:hypothetical protein